MLEASIIKQYSWLLTIIEIVVGALVATAIILIVYYCFEFYDWAVAHEKKLYKVKCAIQDFITAIICLFCFCLLGKLVIFIFREV